MPLPGPGKIETRSGPPHKYSRTCGKLVHRTPTPTKKRKENLGGSDPFNTAPRTLSLAPPRSANYHHQRPVGHRHAPPSYSISKSPNLHHHLSISLHLTFFLALSYCSPFGSNLRLRRLAPRGRLPCDPALARVAIPAFLHLVRLANSLEGSRRW